MTDRTTTITVTMKTARELFPHLADFAARPSGSNPKLVARRREAAEALDYIDSIQQAWTRNP